MMSDNSNLLNPFSKPNQTSKKPAISPSFIEALKDQAKTATFGIGTQAIDQLTGRTPQAAQPEMPQPPFNFAEYLRLRERQIRQHERVIGERERTVETLVFHRKEETAKKEIEIIQQEIKTLVVQTGELSSELVEAEKTISGRVPDIKSGSYYISFFDRIRRLIKLAKKRISESRTWLHVFTARTQARSYYWGQFKKSGTKFLLSQERYMATQAG